MNVPNRATALKVCVFALLYKGQQAAEGIRHRRRGSAQSAFKAMISESVYYMDRGRGVLVTDRQVMIDQQRFDLAQVRDARIANRRSGHVTRLEIGVRAGSVATLLAAMALKAL